MDVTVEKGERINSLTKRLTHDTMGRFWMPKETYRVTGGMSAPCRGAVVTSAANRGVDARPAHGGVDSWASSRNSKNETTPYSPAK